MVQGRGAGVVRWARTATVGVLAAGVVLGGCGVDEPEANPVQSRPVASPSVTWTGERPAAGTFPAVPGYSWRPVSDEEWERTWTALSSSFGGLLADGQAKYAYDADGASVGIVAVAWPAPARGGPAVMQAALDRQGQQAAEHYGTSAVNEVAGHDVLEFTDGHRQPNWYWVSGDEFVMVTGHDDDRGAAFVAALVAATR